MAKIKFGMMMTDARGKLGGQVFSKNRSGAYVRTKVTPVNPRTEFQQANRSLLGTLSSNWSALSESQRNTWNSSVESWQKTNVFGDLTKPTGKNLFTSLNKVMLQQFPDNAVMNLPPAKAEFKAFKVSSATYSVATGFLNVYFEGPGITGTNIQVRATPPVSEGTSYVQNLLRGLGPVEPIQAEGFIGIGEQYRARLGNIQLGNKIFLEVREVTSTGQLGVPYIVQLQVNA